MFVDINILQCFEEDISMYVKEDGKLKLTFHILQGFNV